MAIAILFEAPGMTQAQYEKILARLDPDRTFEKLSDWPDKGVLVHVAGPTEKGNRKTRFESSESDSFRSSRKWASTFSRRSFPW
jgi:hypothetical protein